MPVEGVPERDVVVTFVAPFASYNPGDRAAFHEDEAQALIDEGVAEADGGGATTPPSNVTVPFVSQAGMTLACTMGNWTGEPTSYAYQWNVNGADVGTDSATYDASVAEIGATATCTVTATNAAGSGTAPPSDPHVIAAEGMRPNV